ncbi:MAG TPA: hypothetical protein VMF65_12420 [Acidimicrobiales bacterium]|nr:hypothetical protein [Acidimicrobiales bacterium]
MQAPDRPLSNRQPDDNGQAPFRPRRRRTDEHLLEAVSSARHLVYASIVGIDPIPYAYYRRKLACEALLETSDVPHTVARATQFHELIAMVLQIAERLPVALLPLDFRFQPVAAADVAAHLVALLDAVRGLAST